jgi:hypothetical protein
MVTIDDFLDGDKKIAISNKSNHIMDVLAILEARGVRWSDSMKATEIRLVDEDYIIFYDYTVGRGEYGSKSFHNKLAHCSDQNWIENQGYTVYDAADILFRPVSFIESEFLDLLSK